METTMQMSSLSPLWLAPPIAVVAVGLVLIGVSIAWYKKDHKRFELPTFIAIPLLVVAVFFMGTGFGDRGPATEEALAQIAIEHELTDPTLYGSDIFPCTEKRAPASQDASWVNADGERVYGVLYSEQGVDGVCAYSLVALAG